MVLLLPCRPKAALQPVEQRDEGQRDHDDHPAPALAAQREWTAPRLAMSSGAQMEVAFKRFVANAVCSIVATRKGTYE